MKLAPFGWDESFFLWVQSRAVGSLDYFCGWPTYLGDPLVSLILVFAYLMIWDDDRIGRKFGVIAGATFAGWGLSSMAKLAVVRPRPYLHYYTLIENGDYRIHALFDLLMKESSFPSGHTATIFACVTAINTIYRNRLWPLYLIAAFVGFTRIYTGAHFPSDVLSGAAIGVAAGVAVPTLLCRAFGPARVR